MATNIESPGLPVRNYAQHEESAFRFVIFCVVLAAMIFGLVHAVVYLTDSTDAAARAAAKSVMARTTDQALLVARRPLVGAQLEHRVERMTRRSGKRCISMQS